MENLKLVGQLRVIAAIAPNEVYQEFLQDAAEVLQDGCISENHRQVLLAALDLIADQCRRKEYVILKEAMERIDELDEFYTLIPIKHVGKAVLA